MSELIASLKSRMLRVRRLFSNSGGGGLVNVVFVALRETGSILPVTGAVSSAIKRNREHILIQVVINLVQCQ